MKQAPLFENRCIDLAMTTSPVEIISNVGQELAYILRADVMPENTLFLTPGQFGQEMGLIVYGRGKHIQPHVHLPVTRKVHGTTECVMVRKGACIVDFYDDQKSLLTSRVLAQGDIVLLLGGGHGFRMLEDTVLFEVKQGPYMGDRDKERFDSPVTA